MRKLGAAIFSLGLVCAATAQAQNAQGPKWGPSIDFEGKLGDQRSLGEADALVPFWQDNDTLLFGNARFRFADSNSMEGNFGVGLRHMLGEWNLGTYGYFDRRETTHDNTFNQATFGAEALGTDFDLRANSYWPIGDTTKNVDSLSTASVSGTSVVFRGGEERAFQGFDAEAGWRVPFFEFDSPYDFRVYAGGYHFYDPDDVAPDVTGPRLRAELTMFEPYYFPKGSRVTLGGEVQRDDPRGGQGFLSARLRIPLQSDAQRNRTLTAQERRMTTPIVRDIDIVAQAGAFGAAETATQLANGQSFSLINSASTNVGATFTDELTTAGANSTVILSGTFATTTISTLQGGQTLTAGTILIRSPSGRTAALTTAATIAGTVNNSATIVMVADSTLSGLTITNDTTAGAGSVGVSSGANNVTIANNVIRTSQTGTNNATALALTGGSALISGNTASSTTTPGFTATALLVNGATVTATNNTFSASGGINNATIATAAPSTLRLPRVTC